MSNEILRDGVVSLFGKQFPIVGTVRRTRVDPFPPKFTIGDHSRDDEILKSTWIISDLRGGLGIARGRIPQDADRYWFSWGIEAKYDFITLAQQVFTTPVGPALPPVAIVDFDETLYLIDANNAVYSWDETSMDWVDETHTLLGTPNTVLVFDGELYFQSLNGIDKFDGSIWTQFATNAGGYAAVVWNNLYFRLDGSNIIQHSATPDDQLASWTAGGRLPLPAGYVHQLLVFFDQGGIAAPHAVTRIGVYGYAHEEDRWYETPLSYPVSPELGEASIFRGELVVPPGQSVYQYDGRTIQNISPARDHGLPEEFRGRFAASISGHAFHYLILERELADEFEPATIFGDSPFDNPNVFDDGWSGTVSVGAVLMSPGVSWHVLDVLEDTDGIGAAFCGSTDGRYRFWYSDSNGVYFVTLSNELHSPLRNPNYEFRESGYFETYWNDMGWSEMTKLAVSLDVEARDASELNTIKFEVGWDEDDDWEEIGTVTTDGKTEFFFNGRKGRAFKSMRLRISMTRDPDDSKATPVLRSAVVTFLRMPDVVWGYQFDLDLTNSFGDRTAHQMLEEFYEISELDEVGVFAYKKATGKEQAAHVTISRSAGSERGGVPHSGRYTVAVLSV